MMDYQTHQHIFGALLSKGIVYSFAGAYARDEYKIMLDEMKQGRFGTMDSTHHILSGFKALMSDETVRCIETARVACGGAGFASFSGFTDLFQN